jgi:hypothetical protein
MRNRTPNENANAAKRGKFGAMEGEGSYSGTRDYNKATGEFIAKNKSNIPSMAKDAEDALESPEGDELRKAENKGKAKARH